MFESFSKNFRSFRGNSSKKIDVAHRSGVLDRPGSRELRVVKIPASYDAWRPPKRRKNNSEKKKLGFGNQLFVFFPGFWRESTTLSVRINFLVIFFPDTPILRSVRPKISKKRFVLREPGLCEPHLRAPKSICRVLLWCSWGGGAGHLRVILNGKECSVSFRNSN